MLQGHRVFQEPVGYKRNKQRFGNKTESIIEKIETQASIVKEGLELFANGVFTNNIQLLNFFNEKKLKSNFHSPNPGNLQPTFVERVLDKNKLYFYAGYIIYPEYDINEIIDGKHKAIITLDTVHKIIERLDFKGNKKVGPRKDSSELYPLRGYIFCPHCNNPLTAWKSKGKMGEYYHYYGCNRKECNSKESIRVDKLHEDFKLLLKGLTLDSNLINLFEEILKEIIIEKEKFINQINKGNKARVKDI